MLQKRSTIQFVDLHAKRDMVYQSKALQHAYVIMAFVIGIRYDSSFSELLLEFKIRKYFCGIEIGFQKSIYL